MCIKHKIILFSVMFWVFSFEAHALVEDDAQIVQLRTSCDELGGTLDNCFTSLDSLNTWVQGTRTPEAADPLVVNIGPGEFTGVFECKGAQHITLNGSGRNSTILKRTGTGLGLFLVINLAEDCHLDVHDLQIDNTGGAAAIHVVDTTGPDLNMKTVWNNVEVISSGYTWIEEHCAGSNPVNNSVHFWTASRLTAVDGGLAASAKGYVSCAENWFHATELTSNSQIPSTIPQASALLILGETHVYGGVIRTITGPGIVMPTPGPYSGGAGPQGAVGIYVAGANGEVHVHGAGIDVLSTEPNNIAGIMMEDGGRAHIMDSTFNMSSCDNTDACGGTLQRIADFGGTVRSVFQWESAAAPPKVSSLDGMDTFVETDCAASGCEAAGNETHMLVYNSHCATVGPTTDPWFDIITGTCRGGGNP